MRYSIMGFNQEKLLLFQQSEGLKLDMNDLLLMDYVQKALSQPKMIKTSDEENQPYVWLSHKKILEDIPFLNIGEDMLKKRIKKLIDLKLIKSMVIANDVCKGTRAYYTITELFESLQNDDEITTDKKLPLKEQAGVKNYPSNNLSSIDNNINNTILKNSTAEPSESNSDELPKRVSKRKLFMNDDFSEKEDKQVTTKTENKKMNLYQKCLLEIESFTDDEKLRDALKEYLSIRLKIQGEKRLLGVGQWKGMLRILGGLKGDKVAIVNRSIERGWASFFELKDFQYKNYAQNNNNNKDKFAEGHGVKSVRPEDVEGGQFSGQIF